MQPPPRRVKIPAQVRERIHARARDFATAAANSMIAALEQKLSEELNAAMEMPAQRRPGGLDTVGEGPSDGPSFTLPAG